MLIIIGFFLLTTLAVVIMFWRAAQNAPLRNDWESSADTRWRKYRERYRASLDKAPDTVPDDIMELPHLYTKEIV